MYIIWYYCNTYHMYIIIYIHSYLEMSISLFVVVVAAVVVVVVVVVISSLLDCFIQGSSSCHCQSSYLALSSSNYYLLVDVVSDLQPKRSWK